MTNRIENTVCYKGFRIFNKNIEGFKRYINNFKYAYMAYDGSHYRIWITSESNDKYHKGMILGITADGIEIKGEFRANRPPMLESITADWRSLLKSHIIDCRENWIFCNED